jgi:hypothetical protein
MKINIAISAYNRPEYSQRSIAAIFGAKGFTPDKYRIFCAIDCYADGSFNQEVYNIYQFFGAIPDVAEQKRGCNYNVRRALELAWEDNPDFVLMIEDDIIISDDALQYIEWAAEKYKDDQFVRTIGLWKSKNGWDFDKPLTKSILSRIDEQVWFSCWGWGTWRNRWEEMLATWTTGDDSHDTSWDVVLYSHLGGRKEIVPAISRAYNCGEFNGTHRGKAWPGVTAAGLVDPDDTINYWTKTIYENI